MGAIVVAVITVWLNRGKDGAASHKSPTAAPNLEKREIEELASQEKRSEAPGLTATASPTAAPSAEQLASVALPPRNEFFTGRMEKLQELDEALRSSHKAALSGLGGTGKTQIALEHTHKNREQYTHIFWIRAETDQDLKGGFVAVAHLLDLPGKDTQNPDDPGAGRPRVVFGE